MNEKEIAEYYENLSLETKQFIAKVIKIEKSKKHLGKPYGVYQELLDALDKIVK
jgi:hypothetical protein